MAMGVFEVHAGAFELGRAHQVVRGHLLMKSPGRFLREKIPLSQITDLEIASEESLNRLGGAVGWGIAGDVLLGPVGLLAGLLRGGTGKRVTFVCRLRDGRTFLASASSSVFSKMRTSLAISEFGQTATNARANTSSEASSAASFDRQKWGALLQYDKDIALAAEQIRPLGEKRLDDLATAYLALNDKQYLPAIVDKIIERAKLEPELKGAPDISTVAVRDPDRLGSHASCRVCRKAVTHNAEHCPYCGTASPLRGDRSVGTIGAKSIMSIVAWLYAIFFGLGGIAMVMEGSFWAILLILSCLVALPISSTLLLKFFKIETSGWARALAAFVLFVVAMIGIGRTGGAATTVAEASAPPSRIAADVKQPEPTDLVDDFNKCLLDNAKDGKYSSKDGGKSAIRLLGACESQWHAYSDDCERSGKTDGECTLQSGILAQAALKMSGK